MVDKKREAALRRDIEALYFAYRSFTSLPDQILTEHGLNRAHHRILYFVVRTPDISMNELLSTLNISKQAVQRPLKELEALGFLQVSADGQDRRMRRIHATKEGEELEARLSGEQMMLLEKVFSNFDSKAEIQWRHILEHLAQTGDAQE